MSGRLCTTCMEWEKHDDFDICLSCLEKEEEAAKEYALGTSIRLIVENNQREDILFALRKWLKDCELTPNSKRHLNRLIDQVDKAGTTGDRKLVSDNDGHVFSVDEDDVATFREAMQDDDSIKWEEMLAKHSGDYVGRFTDLIANTKGQPLLNHVCESLRAEHE